MFRLRLHSELAMDELYSLMDAGQPYAQPAAKLPRLEVAAVVSDR
jgi:hypothetical protein